MPSLRPVSRAELVRRLHALGFDGPYSGTRHQFMIRGTIRLTLPNPHRGDVGVALLGRILREAEISQAEWHLSASS